MNRIILPLLTALGITLFVAHFVTKTTVNGAQLGGTNISPAETLRANLTPDSFYWSKYPFGLLVGSVLGLIVFIIIYYLNRPISKRN